MKRFFLTIGLVSLYMLLAAANADYFRVPNGIIRIESQAFENAAVGCDSVLIYPCVASIASDAFSANIRTVYGAAGSAAEQFARATGRTFVPFVPVTGITLSAPPSYLFIGKSASVAATVAPANATYGTPVYTSSNSGIISVDASGKLTAIAPGTVTITATADGMSASAQVSAVRKPTSVRIEKQDPSFVLYTKGKMQLVPVFGPDGAYSEKLTWREPTDYYAGVDANGLVTGWRPGTTKITCSVLDADGISASLTITVLQGPTSVTLSAPRATLFPGDQLWIESTVLPSDAANKTLTWTTSNPSIATVDQNGVVSPAGASGVVTITATTVNGFSSAVTLRAYDQAAPRSFSLGTSELFLNKGETYTLVNSVLPAGAISSAEWTSTNPSIVSVDANGCLTAHTYGSSRITATSTMDTSICATCTVVVLNPNRTLSMPARRTGTDGISVNLGKISALKASAYEELKTLYSEEKISSNVMSARESVISRAFEMYSFPWMTLNPQKYWSAEYSEGGAKDFQPGIVYYGLPYISGSFDSQRLYNTAKAISNNRFYRSSEGNYYILNQNNLVDGTYCGNDCSSFVSFCLFSQSTAESRAWRTNTFATTSEFTTLKKTDELYPGDILVKSYAHVVLFLYYANPEHTQIVVIEQGGPEAAISTVNASVYNINYFYSNEFIPRRYSGWC